jgi:HAD superfamily phosphoserine phosphatase-like hydrolase
MRKTPAVYFDLDGTWYRWQLFDAWVAMCVELGVMKQIVIELSKPQLSAYKRRRGKFSDFIDAAVFAYQGEHRLRGIRLSDARFAANKVIERDGDKTHVFTERLSQAARDLDVWRSVISGSPKEVVQAFVEAHGITEVFATEHPCGRTRYLGGEPVLWSTRKDEAVKISAERNNIDLRRSVAIGDSMSDVAMFERVGYPICFNPEKRLLAAAKENWWSVVFEKKDAITAFKPDGGGRLVEAEFSEILPPRLAKRLEKLLAAVAL